jgi:hypothetical protein
MTPEKRMEPPWFECVVYGAKVGVLGCAIYLLLVFNYHLEKLIKL